MLNKTGPLFCPTDSVNELYQATAEHIRDVAQRLAVEFTEITSEDALMQNRSELATLGQGPAWEWLNSLQR